MAYIGGTGFHVSPLKCDNSGYDPYFELTIPTRYSTINIYIFQNLQNTVQRLYTGQILYNNQVELHMIFHINTRRLYVVKVKRESVVIGDINHTF